MTFLILSAMCCHCCLVAQSCITLCNPMDCSRPGSSVHGGSVSKNIGVGCHFLLQGIFSTQRLNAPLLHWQACSLPLSIRGALVATMWGRSKKMVIHEPGSRFSPDAKSAGTLIWDFPASSSMRNKFPLFVSHLVHGLPLQQFKWT